MPINSVCISGRLTKDPELRRTANDKAVLSFTLAVNERHKDKNGDWVDDPIFIDCRLWGGAAEYAEKMIGKGTMLSCQGKLKQDNWEKDGQKRSKITMTVGEFEILTKYEQHEENYIYEEEIPF